ncbi:hypothetical protein GOP47_0002979 [Adiantum capillus-veneris]|uniref:Uncharacterized protein n=1 Tax=Adiantum capillus-veneris TaxID=13818 RepID=A0A9D4VB42_ADICA|nr:hypothetical protein GOP47_0002979 [Adiantum capillus-veneris]
MRHKFSKQELEHVKKDYDDFLRDLSAGKNIQTLIPEADGFSKFFALLQERERKKLTLEFEARLAAEEKARIYEASAEAAESRLLQLLDERTKLHLKFDEELEQKEVERVRLHSLFEKERLKSETAKKELHDLKEKFASLLSRAPLSSGVKCDDLREISLSPRHFFKLSDVLEKRDVFENEKREEPSKLSVCSNKGDCGTAQKKIETIEDAMTERSIQFKNRETCILQQVRQQEMQLKTAEDAFQELERKLKHVELDKGPLKECPDHSQTQHKNAKLMEKSTQTSSWNDGVYEKYSCVYQSPIFEHNHPKAKSGKGFFDATSETDSDERELNYREQREDQTDIEIRQLTQELKNIGADMLSLHKVPDSNGNNFARINDFNHAESSLDKPMNEEEVTNQTLKRILKEKTLQLNKVLTQHAKELQRMQSSTSQAHELNKQLASNVANSETKLAELQGHYNSLLGSLENQLNEARKDVQDLRKDAVQLRDGLSESDQKLKELKESADLRQVELTEARRAKQELKKEKDTIEKEKSDLSVKLQEAHKEVNEQASRVAEYLSINEELLDFAQRKENEVSVLSQQVQTLQEQILEKANADSKLQSDFEEARKELNEVQKAYSSIESENELLKSKLSENNLQLLQQEGTIATLTKQMADIMQGRDSMLEEAAQFHGYLQNAKYKEFELENKLRQSSSHIKDLEKRLQDMESESIRSRSELADLKKQNSTLQKLVEDKDNDTLGLKKSVNELRKKVQDLEEEVLLKEGQIAIISSQNRENYETF